MSIEVGSLVMKIAGRDAGKRAAVVEIVGNRALLDGETRRRKANLAHLEPLGQQVDIRKGASHEEVKEALSGLKITVRETKQKNAGKRPKKVRKPKPKPEQTKGAAKKEAKKDSEAQEKKSVAKDEAKPITKNAQKKPEEKK